MPPSSLETNPNKSLLINGQGEGNGPALFQTQMEQWFSIGLAVSSKKAPFQTQLDGYCGKRLRFAALRFSPHTTSSVHIGRKPRRLLLSLQKEGHDYVRQGERESDINPGDIFLLDPLQPFHIETSAMLTYSVYLEPDSLRMLLPDYEQLTAYKIPCIKGTAAVLRTSIEELFKNASKLNETTADHIASALAHLIAAAYLEQGFAKKTSPSKVHSMHRERILRFARENLQNPELDTKSNRQSLTALLTRSESDQAARARSWLSSCVHRPLASVPVVRSKVRVCESR